MAGKSQGTPRERFDRSYRIEPNGCWTWTGSRNRHGYGRMGIGPRAEHYTALAHRLSWELHFGAIPGGLGVCHHCDNPPCVNPAHLFVGTQADNMQDASAKGRVRNGPSQGQQNGRSKLTDAQVREIRKLYAEIKSHRQVAARFGVSRTLIRLILAGRNWTHVQ